MSEKITTISVVINTCYGGFSLSQEAAEEVLKRKGIEYRLEEIGRKRFYPFIGTTWDMVTDRFPRYDPDIVAVVTELGDRANGECAKLKVVKFNISVDISSFDGKETAHVYGNEVYR